jgi:response regulator RpfG family c-di-GMP phosphodiesterase
MFNKDFLQTLTILYVEDDDAIRNSLGTILKKVFKEVITCVDGRDGISNYELYTRDMDVVFDAIISDINMPNMNGLEMVKKIREHDMEIPVVMTTAHGESNYLLEAIKLGVSGYTLKPIDTKELLMTVQRFCEIKRNQRIIAEKEAELSEYMEFINGIATIVKVDKKDIVQEVNPFFCGINEAMESDLVHTNMIQLIHPDSISSTYKEMKEFIKNGLTWKGKLKFISKNKEVFYLRSTSIPTKNHDTDEVTGYISIGFLADDEEQEKQETMSKAKQNIMEERYKILELNKKVKTLRTATNNFEANMGEQSSSFIKEALENERKKTSEQLKQIQHYEYQISLLKEKLIGIADNEKLKRTDSLRRVNDLSRENAILRDRLITVQNELYALQQKDAPKYIE